MEHPHHPEVRRVARNQVGGKAARSASRAAHILHGKLPALVGDDRAAMLPGVAAWKASTTLLLEQRHHCRGEAIGMRRFGGRGEVFEVSEHART